MGDVDQGLNLPAGDTAARLKIVSHLHRKGHESGAIAQRIGVSEQQVNLDLQTIHRLWLRSTARDISAAKAEALAKLDMLEACYWDAWRNSKSNADYLAGVLGCIERRCQLLGLNVPIKHDLAGVNGKQRPPVGQGARTAAFGPGTKPAEYAGPGSAIRAAPATSPGSHGCIRPRQRSPG